MKKQDLIDAISEYFNIGINDGTYAYHLTRVKRAFHIGTVTLDDFVEFDEETSMDLADHICKKLNISPDEE